MPNRQQGPSHHCKVSLDVGEAHDMLVSTTTNSQH